MKQALALGGYDNGEDLFCPMLSLEYRKTQDL